MIRKNWMIWIGLTVLCFTKCEKNPQNSVYRKEVTVFGYLWGNQPLGLSNAISIHYSQPLDREFSFESAAIQNARVTLTDSVTGESWALKDEQNPGKYFNENLVIRASTTYLLQIETDDRIITASTTVPPAPAFETDLKTDEVNVEFQKNLGYEKPVRVTCEHCLDSQMLLVDMFCDEPYENARYINPFFGQDKPTSQEEYDGGINGEPRHIQAFVSYQDLVSPDFNHDYVIYWYASMIVFYGRYTMQIMTVDDNYLNFVFDEHPMLSGGIQGGIGLFASMCGQTFQLNIQTN